MLITTKTFGKHRPLLHRSLLKKWHYSQLSEIFILFMVSALSIKPILDDPVDNAMKQSGNQVSVITIMENVILLGWYFSLEWRDLIQCVCSCMVRDLWSQTKGPRF